jgi:rhodanese-related sulfurtransferase
MDAKKVKKLVEDDADIVILDVRNEYELENGAIPKSINIPLKEIAGKIVQGTLPFDKTQTIIVSCQTGGRSRVALMMLRSAGYKAENLDGGYEAWRKQHKPLP